MQPPLVPPLLYPSPHPVPPFLAAQKAQTTGGGVSYPPLAPCGPLTASSGSAVHNFCDTGTVLTMPARDNKIEPLGF